MTPRWILCALLVTFTLTAPLVLAADPAPGFHVTQITGGGGYTCALTADHRVWCWGENRDGQLGQGYVDSSAATVSHFIPLEVPLPDAVEVTGGLTGAVCAVTAAGQVYCWGATEFAVDHPTPTLVPGLDGVAHIAVGSRHFCAAKVDGTAWCWGDNSWGQLGWGSTGYSSTPVQVVGLTGVTSITNGYWHSCAHKSDASLWCWGRNAEGQLGAGLGAPWAFAPVQVVGLSGDSLDAGGWHTCARRSGDATVWCWGANFWGQVGDGTLTARSLPTQVVQLAPGLGPDDEATWVATAWMHTCAGKADGTTWCWGNADYGQMGDGTWGILPGLHYVFPVQTKHVGFVQVGMGAFHMCGAEADGALWCWGDNHFGQTGYLNPQQPALGNTCFNYPSCTVSIPMPVVSRTN